MLLFERNTYPISVFSGVSGETRRQLKTAESNNISPKLNISLAYCTFVYILTMEAIAIGISAALYKGFLAKGMYL